MPFGPDYVTLAEFKAWLHVDADDDADDDQLQLALSSACRAVDDHTGRQFGQLPAPEPFYAEAWGRASDGYWCATTPDLMTTTGLVLSVNGTAVAAEYYRLTPRNASWKGMPYTGIEFYTGVGTDVVVTARWGWTTAPPGVKLATLLQASRFHARRGSPYGIAGSPDQGNEMRLLARVDADVAVALRGYRRRPTVA